MARLLLLLLMLALPAQAETFNLLVMPDTQLYSTPYYGGIGPAHMDRIARWICTHPNWTDPDTGTTAPIRAVLHLGDVVQRGDYTDASGRLIEWEVMDAAFDQLDACGRPYLVVPGNHDFRWPNYYSSASRGFTTYFGPDRYAAYPWFLGAGPPVEARSRRKLAAPYLHGPPTTEPSRHRVIQIGGWLIIGLDMAFDFPPAEAPGQQDEAEWLHSVLDVLPHRWPAIIVQHFLSPRSDALFHADSPGLWYEIVDNPARPHRQIVLTLAGHAPGESIQTAQRRIAGPLTYGVIDYQSTRCAGEVYGYGCGWQMMLTVDEAAHTFRFRSFQISNTDPPTVIDYDWRGVGPHEVSYQ